MKNCFFFIQGTIYTDQSVKTLQHTAAYNNRHSPRSHERTYLARVLKELQYIVVSWDENSHNWKS